MNEPDGRPPIVVGVDGSEDSKYALRWAAQQAELTNAPLQAITAWHFPIDFGTAWQIPATYGRSHDFSGVDFSEEAKRTLDGTIEEVLGKDPRVSVTPELVSGHPAQVLIDASQQAGLLVLGASGHGGFVGMLLGSVTQHCVSHSACPVVVVRHPAEN
jgi:nucleotide-binding universal stress UspA family protein